MRRLLWAGLMGFGVLAASAGESRRALVYATYLGGASGDVVTGLSLEPDGGVVISGVTASTDFPFPPEVTRPKGESVGFLIKLSAFGDQIEWVRFPNLPPGLLARPLGPDGNLYAAGQLRPGQTIELTSGAVDLNDGDYGQSYLIKLDATGERVLAVARITGLVRALTTDRQGNVYLAGEAREGFPITVGAAQPRTGGGTCSLPRRQFPCPDAFVMKLNATLTRVKYSTFLGGSAEDFATAVAVDDDGSVVVTGQTSSNDFPTTAGALQRTFRGRVTIGPVWYGDAFVSKLDANGRRLVYSTYLGGSAADVPEVLKLDSNGNAYVGGGTDSTDFPTSPGAHQSGHGGPSGGPPSGHRDGFVVKLSTAGAMRFSTYVGGEDIDYVTSLVIRNDGIVFLSRAFLLTDIFGARCRNAERAELSMLDEAGSTLQSLYGRSGQLMMLDREGVLYTAGSTKKFTFFATPGALQTRYGGGDNDGFVSKLIATVDSAPALHCVSNAASNIQGLASSFPLGTVAPGEIIAIYGTELDRTMRVLFDGKEAPLLYVSETQINAIVPFGIDAQATRLSVDVAGELLGAYELPVSPAVPGIFTFDGSGVGQAAALNEDGSINLPAVPAAAGSVMVLYATGAGVMTPVQSDGEVTRLQGPWPAPALDVSVVIEGRPAQVLYAGAAPGLLAGVIQVNARIPVETRASFPAMVMLRVGNYQSQVVTISVR